MVLTEKTQRSFAQGQAAWTLLPARPSCRKPRSQKGHPVAAVLMTVCCHCCMEDSCSVYVLCLFVCLAFDLACLLCLLLGCPDAEARTSCVYDVGLVTASLHGSLSSHLKAQLQPPGNPAAQSAASSSKASRRLRHVVRERGAGRTGRRTDLVKRCWQKGHCMALCFELFPKETFRTTQKGSLILMHM